MHCMIRISVHTNRDYAPDTVLPNFTLLSPSAVVTAALLPVQLKRYFAPNLTDLVQCKHC